LNTNKREKAIASSRLFGSIGYVVTGYICN